MHKQLKLPAHVLFRKDITQGVAEVEGKYRVRKKKKNEQIEDNMRRAVGPTPAPFLSINCSRFAMRSARVARRATATGRQPDGCPNHETRELLPYAARPQ